MQLKNATHFPHFSKFCDAQKTPALRYKFDSTEYEAYIVSAFLVDVHASLVLVGVVVIGVGLHVTEGRGSYQEDVGAKDGR